MHVFLFLDHVQLVFAVHVDSNEDFVVDQHLKERMLLIEMQKSDLNKPAGLTNGSPDETQISIGNFNK
jgi:hypothetical protein